MPKSTVTLTYAPTERVWSPGLKPGDTVTVPADEAAALLAGGAFKRTKTDTPEQSEPAQKEKKA